MVGSRVLRALRAVLVSTRAASGCFRAALAASSTRHIHVGSKLVLLAVGVAVGAAFAAYTYARTRTADPWKLFDWLDDALYPRHLPCDPHLTIGAGGAP